MVQQNPSVNPMDSERVYSLEEMGRRGRDAVKRLANDVVFPSLSGEELKEYQAKRFKEEIDKFDTDTFKEYLNNPDKLASLKSQPGKTQAEQMSKQAKQQLAMGGAGRSMWMGAMCLTPILREGLNGEAIASLAGLMSVMAMGYLLKTPARIQNSKIQAANKEVSDHWKDVSRAQRFDEWADKWEAEAADRGMSPRKEFILKNYVKPLRNRFASKAGFRIGMSEESIGIAGAALLADANRELMSAETDEEISSIREEYDNSIKQLKTFAMEDGISPEAVDKAINKAYANFAYQTTMENNGYTIHGVDTVYPDFRTTESSIPTVLRDNDESQNEAFIDYDDERGPSFKTVDEQGQVVDYEGSLHPAGKVGVEEACEAIRMTMEDVSSNLGSYKYIPYLENALHSFVTNTSTSRKGMYVPPNGFKEPDFVKGVVDVSNIYNQVYVSDFAKQVVDGTFDTDTATNEFVKYSAKPMVRQLLISRDKMILQNGITAPEYEERVSDALNAVNDFVRGGAILPSGEAYNQDALLQDLTELQQVMDGRRHVSEINSDNVFNKPGIVSEESILMDMVDLQQDVSHVRAAAQHYPALAENYDIIKEHDQQRILLTGRDMIGRLGLLIQEGENTNPHLDVEFSKRVNSMLGSSNDNFYADNKSYEDISLDTRRIMSDFRTIPYQYIDEQAFGHQACAGYIGQAVFSDGYTAITACHMDDSLLYAYIDQYGDDLDWYNIEDSFKQKREYYESRERESKREHANDASLIPELPEGSSFDSPDYEVI